MSDWVGLPRSAGKVYLLMRVLVGPTASGKTEVACKVASRIGAEVVCADAMTIWRGLDIGTAKPNFDQRASVAHHLLDIAEPGQMFTLADLALAAQESVKAIESRGFHPLVVGGSGLTLRAIVDGLELPPTNPAVRQRLAALTPDEAIRRLRELDSAAFGYIEAGNHRRVVRALEIAELTGERPSQLRRDWERRADVPVVGLMLTKEQLGDRIANRVNQMFEEGWIEECQAFLDAGRMEDLLATQALGYREVVDVLLGRHSLEEARHAITKATFKLSRRQMTWLRADPRVVWVDAGDPDLATEAVLAAYSST